MSCLLTDDSSSWTDKNKNNNNNKAPQNICPEIDFNLLHHFAALPEEGPKITGGRARYQLGEWVDVNCTSGRSRPATQLSWFINGDLANPDYLRHFETVVTGREGLETSTLGLRFKVKHKHFRRGDMKLKVNTRTSLAKDLGKEKSQTLFHTFSLFRPLLNSVSGHHRFRVLAQQRGECCGGPAAEDAVRVQGTGVCWEYASGSRPR